MYLTSKDYENALEALRMVSHYYTERNDHKKALAFRLTRKRMSLEYVYLQEQGEVMQQ